MAILAALVLAGCGGTSRPGACAAAPVKTGAPPDWAAPAFADSSPGLKVPYALAAGDEAAAIFFARLRAGHPTNPSNKVLWIVRAPRDGKPLHIVARQGGRTVRITRPADSGPGEIYPSYVDLPSSGCWRLDLAWGPHRARIDVAVADGAGRRRTTPVELGGAPLRRRTGLRLLVAGAPPYVLDVDSGRVTPVAGLRFGRFPVVDVRRAGRNAAFWVDPGRVYLLRHGSLRARLAGHGRDVARGRSGSAPWAVAGRYVLRSGRQLTLTDVRTGARRTLARPSAIRFPDEAATAPDGRHVALDFADPAYRSSATQVMDVWLLDARTGRLTQLPGMPAIVHLKSTSFAWARDGRLVLLAQDAGVVAVWRPGQRRLAVAHLRLPQPSGGSDTFIVWRSARRPASGAR